MKFLKNFALTAAGLLIVATAAADTYPSKPIRIISPIPAGGSNDILARDVGAELQKRLGQSVVIENKPGAAGSIGTAEGARAQPDGYTITLVYSSHSINPHLYKSLSYDAIKDFSPVVLMASLPMGLFVHPSMPAKNVEEFIALAKEKPGSINYASSGNGSVSHMVGAMFAHTTNTELTHIPYRGSMPAKTDLLAGRVQAMFADVDLVQQHVKLGELRPLAIATQERLPGYEDVPTFVEAGLPDMVVSSQVGFLVPAGTPAAIIEKLNREIVEILHEPEMTKRINGRGMTVVASTPDEFSRIIKDDLERFGVVARSANMQIN